VLASRLRAAAAAIEAVELPGRHVTESERDRSSAAALGAAGLFELVVPAGTIDTRGLFKVRRARHDRAWCHG
jgi:hypothetical protein